MTLEPGVDEIDDDEDGGNGADDGYDAADDDDEDDEYDEDDERIPWAECKVQGVDDYDGQLVYRIDWYGGILEMGERVGRIVDQYEAARRRQAEALALAERRWKKPPPAPDPAETAPAETLTPRQEEFCRHYATRPVAAHAAMLAGYGEENARNQGARLLKNPRILARIEALRAERGARHTLEACTLQDKLESVFVDALTANHHAAAVAALRLQAGLARLPTRSATRDEASAAPSNGAEPEATPQAGTLWPEEPKADKSRR